MRNRAKLIAHPTPKTKKWMVSLMVVLFMPTLPVGMANDIAHSPSNTQVSAPLVTRQLQLKDAFNADNSADVSIVHSTLISSVDDDAFYNAWNNLNREKAKLGGHPSVQRLSDNYAATDSDTSATADSNTDDVAKHIRDLSVKLECGQSLCSGSIIGQNKIMTAKHCLFDEEGELHDIKTCKVIHRDEDYELFDNFSIVADREEWTVMHIKDSFPKDVKPLKVANTLTPYQKETFKKEILCGKSPTFYMYDEIYDKRTRRCEISGITEKNTESDMFHHNCQITFGNSGSGLMKKFNDDFYLIGINSQKDIYASHFSFHSIMDVKRSF